MLGRLILASASPRRLSLLAQIGIVAAEVVAAEIEEAPRPGEQPRELAARLAKAKANHVAEHFPDDFVLGADTVVACGRRILPKANDEAKARTSLELISGRCHRVLGGVSKYGSINFMKIIVLLQIIIYYTFLNNYLIT